MENPHNYRGILFAFMRYNDNIHYADDFVFTNEHLKEVTAGDVVAWFSFKAYGTNVPGPEDKPLHAQSNSMKNWKKALFYYMPNRLHQWNELTGQGNPTRSTALNNLIKRVKKFEVRGQGAPSKVRRPMKAAEFRSVVSECHKLPEDDIIGRYGLPVLLAFQFHMIGRVDNCCNWRQENLAEHDIHAEKCARARMAWSKTVAEERDAPCFWLYGCNLPCLVQPFHRFVPSARIRPFVFGFSQETEDEDKAGNQAKALVYQILRPIIESLGVKLGSHLIRKYASTWVRSNGISKDDKDHHGRWKIRKTPCRLVWYFPYLACACATAVNYASGYG